MGLGVWVECVEEVGEWRGREEGNGRFLGHMGRENDGGFENSLAIHFWGVEKRASF